MLLANLFFSFYQEFLTNRPLIKNCTVYERHIEKKKKKKKQTNKL